MWRLMPGQALRFRQFDDQVVVYNDLSGDTHLLGDSAAHLLSLLQQGPAPAARLLDALAAAHDSARDAAFDEQAGAVLDQLAALFLIELLPC
ncbi:HPr-rel-A system PqqD family peptide chaperone [Massilia sp. CF038]|uniref:HPr-rel-A system PqqD family peptide chaperone n=1 Tax=Massilia sp. CF038 TaxID=1881045 RepID=UPI0009244F76|nr:HPr-rel-A system PqqD family peptide chaperone [Massilia sp. CF038]SHH41370.1 PqqD family protein, HPr-rel-A system [Massilia sp. CF038]